jgi:predicted SprT family Zn-dependent metalloprotease
MRSPLSHSKQAEIAQVVRHELAHHLGWDELGVRDLGL